MEALVKATLDDEGFFKASPIPASFKQAVKQDLEPFDSAKAKAIKLSLSKWKNAELTPEQEHVVALLQASVVAFGQLKRDSTLVFNNSKAEALEMSAKFIDFSIQLADKAAHVGIGMSPAGDFVDFCEAVTGRNFCLPNGKELSVHERVAAGVGLVVFNRLVWKRIAESVGIFKGAKGFSEVALVLEKGLVNSKVLSSVVKSLPDVKVHPDIAETFKDGSVKVGIITEDITLVRYWGKYTSEDPKLFGADKFGRYFGNKLYKTEEEFRKGAVVFKEWNAATFATFFKVKKGTVVAFGKIKNQVLKSSKSVSKTTQKLDASEDLQFVLQPNAADFANAKNASETLLKSGQLEEIATIATNFGSLK